VSHVLHTVRSPPAVSKAGADSRDTVAGLLDRYGDRACRIARAVCRDERRAQNAVVDAFSSVSQSSFAAPGRSAPG
jgi:DNA-directed RNA polymerase specialized sigma24 family protein